MLIITTIILMYAEMYWQLKLRNDKTKPGTPDAMFPCNECGFGPKYSKTGPDKVSFKALPDTSSDEFTDS